MAMAHGDQAAADGTCLAGKMPDGDVPFGEWPSPITAAEVARGTVKHERRSVFASVFLYPTRKC